MSRPVPVWPKGIAVVCAAWLVAGCAETGTKVVSKADGGRVQSGQRLLVVSHLAWADQMWAEAFEKAMLSELRQVRTASGVQTESPLALHADKVRYASEVAEFNPDLVLVVEPGDGTADQQGRNLMRRFEAGLFRHYTERARRELIWRATVVLEPAGYFIAPSDMTALARDLIGRLTADGVLPKPKRSAGALPSRTIAPPASKTTGGH